VKLLLEIIYPEKYPDVIPEMTLTPTEGELETSEMDSLIDQLKSVGEENVGIAMTFSIVSHLRELLLQLVSSRLERRIQEEKEKERRELEEEAAKTRGTPVTVASFKEWKAKFDKELAIRKAREEEERLKALSPKDREEYKKVQTRYTGRQLFERDRNLASEDAALVEDGTVSVDISQYERSKDDEEEEEERLEFSDSD